MRAFMASASHRQKRKPLKMLGNLTQSQARAIAAMQCVKPLSGEHQAGIVFPYALLEMENPSTMAGACC
jgi:hypothetical protein